MECNYMLTERLGDPVQGYFNTSLILRLFLSRDECEEISTFRLCSLLFHFFEIWSSRITASSFETCCYDVVI